MLLAVLLGLFASPATAADTTVNFGVVQRDLTGDGVPESLSLTGVGNTLDNLAVTFVIRASGQALYTRSWRLTRARFDPRHRISDAELRTRLRDYGRSFFDASKFTTPPAFLSWLAQSARLRIAEIPGVMARDMTHPDSVRAAGLWQDMQAAAITIFSFSPGGDFVTAIGWSAADTRFYHLFECC